MERLECDRMFVAVVDTGSFTRAAARLGTSSGQASKLVSKLEADLGVRLLNRTTRALSPTEVGLAYHERMKGLLEEFDALDAAVRHASGMASGRLKISVPITFGTSQLSPLLIDFAGAYPDIQLDVHYSDRAVNLVDEGFDVAVRVGRPADSSLIARKLCHIKVVVVASPDYLATRGTPEHPEDLAHHTCIVDTNFREPLLWRFHAGDASKDPCVMAVSGRLRFSNAEACRSAAEAGLGIARIPSFIAADALRTGRLKPLLIPYGEAERGAYALYPPGRHLALKVRVLVDFLSLRFRGEPAWDQGWA